MTSGTVPGKSFRWPGGWRTVPSFRLVYASERGRAVLVLVVALLQGVLHLALMPPWQHYDEPTHFEYAWLIANSGRLPASGATDTGLRRELVASMIEHRFYDRVPQPNWLSDDRRIEIGPSELRHPPAYYLLVSLPLRLTHFLPVASQLYVARTVSLLLFLITVTVTLGLMRDLTPAGHILRWAVPLTLAGMPPFVDIMTAINSDVGAVLVFSLFLWGAVRTIRFGVTWRRATWVIGTALLALLVKNTAAPAVVLLPVVFSIAAWVHRRWRWRWLILGWLALLAAGLVVVFELNDAAYWYRWREAAIQAAPTRVHDPAAPVGPHAVALESRSRDERRVLSTPILPADVAPLAGHQVTVGGWIWANRAATIRGVGLNIGQQGSQDLNPVSRPVTVTTEPRFVAWTFELPADTAALHFIFSGASVAPTTEWLRVRLDGAILVDGAYSADAPPEFDNISAHTGTWSGQRFTNLVRTASAEAAWPRLRPWGEHALARASPQSPVQVLEALFDVQRTGPVLINPIAFTVLQGFFNGFGWGHIWMRGSVWPVVFLALALSSVVGCARWLFQSEPSRARELRPALLFLGLAGVLGWSLAILRPLPLFEARMVFPTARYAFPAMIPTVLVLVAGWSALWTRSYRLFGMCLLVGFMIGLNVAAVWTIKSFYGSLPFT